MSNQHSDSPIDTLDLQGTGVNILQVSVRVLFCALILIAGIFVVAKTLVSAVVGR
jgi:hypothetical protein